MNNNNDEMLDDLLKYYDSDSTQNDGDTTVINIKKPIPTDETLGDTVIVNTKKKQPEKQTESFADETVQINTAETAPYVETTPIPEDEVFGNMDLSGRIIKREPEPQMDIQRYDSTHQPNRQPTQMRRNSVPPRPKRSLWYTLKPLWATMIVCAVLVFAYLFYTTDSGIVGIYKRNFSYNFSLILRSLGIEYDNSDDMPLVGANFENPFIMTAYAAEEEITYKITDNAKATIPFEGADDAKYEKTKNGVVCTKSSYICFINKSGKKKWEHTTTISDPILSVSGNYAAIAARNSTQLILYKDGEQVFAIDAPNNIKSCRVSENGDVVLITDKTAYKGAVSFINNKGEEVFSWISGVNYITSAEILKNRRVAVALASTEDAVKSYVMIFDIYSTDPLGGAEIPDSLVFDLDAHKKNVYSCADNAISSVKSDGTLNYTVRFDDMDITHTSSDRNGWRFVSYTDNNLPCINVYKPNGNLYSSMSAENTPEYADLYKATVLYNNGRDIICGHINRKKHKYRAPMAVKGLIMITNDTYMVAYENSLEIVKI